MNLYIFSSIKGIRPELKLLTTDGATLLSTDPVNLLLSLTDDNSIKSEILDWKLPPLAQRYLESCCEGKIRKLFRNNLDLHFKFYFCFSCGSSDK